MTGLLKPVLLTLGLGLMSLPPPLQAADCSRTKLREIPQDPGQKGPWEVGARTVMVDDFAVEVWYPAARQAGPGEEQLIYDIREHLPAEDAILIPDESNPEQICDCYAGLPIDADHGPYPVVIQVHGTAGFRSASASQAVHWASRGFVVLAADHPRIRLKDMMGPFGLIGMALATQRSDTEEIINTLRSPAGDLAFLRNLIDTDRIGLTGHSAGGGAIAALGNEKGVKVLMPMASFGGGSGSEVESVLILAGTDDGLGNYERQSSSFGGSDVPRSRFVGLAGAGHLAFTDICIIGADRGGILQIALDHGMDVPAIVNNLGRDGCGDRYLPIEDGFAIINYASTIVLEETLQCSPGIAARWDGLQNLPGLEDALEAL